MTKSDKITPAQFGLFAAALAVFLLARYTESHAADPALLETRYGDGVVRRSDGSIARRADVLRAYQAIHPCPSTGLTSGGCPDYELNHNIPLACGGRDEVSNLSWIHVAYKHGWYRTAGGKIARMGYLNDNGSFVDMSRFASDRIERKINALSPPVPDTANCVNVVVQ